MPKYVWKCLSYVIQLDLEGWNFLPRLSYEQIYFKCKFCYEHEHFAKNYPNKYKS